MISVADAKNKVLAEVPVLNARVLPIEAVAGLVLAEDVLAPENMPMFPQSAMDGYAFRFADWEQGKPLPVTAVVAAGSSQHFELRAKEVARIFTGAPLPEGADTVVMQEKTKRLGDDVLIEDEALLLGGNVRPIGSEISQGAVALQKGAVLTPAAIGFLAGLGLAEIKVYPKPSVALLVTGNELQTPGQSLGYGQVYESNSYMLQAALWQLGIHDIEVHLVKDNVEALEATLAGAMSRNNLVLLTGGVSVGDYDFVLPAAERCGVHKIFHKVAQKPGKPLFFGMKEHNTVFGLPGNPSSVLTCFYQYVVPALCKMMQRRDFMQIEMLPLELEVRKKKGLTHFMKGYHSAGKVKALTAQESFRLSSFALSNCLIELDAEQEVFAEGAMVPVHLLPV